MLRLLLVTAIGLGLVMPRPASPQPDDAFEAIRHWAPERGAKATVTGGTLRLQHGSIWTDDTWVDFAMRFEYRPIGAAGRADLLLRAHAAPEGTLYAYKVSLQPGPERGRLMALRHGMQEAAVTAAAPPVDGTGWTAVEVRALGARLSVSLDGTLVSSADRADARSGYIGFTATGNGVELRAVRITRLVVEPALDTLPRVTKDSTPPTIRHRVQPAYTRAAMRAVAQGVAMLEFAILPDGSVGDIRVLKSPHKELASAAIDCVHQWRFAPVVKDGVPIAVRATMELSFRLK